MGLRELAREAESGPGLYANWVGNILKPLGQIPVKIATILPELTRCCCIAGVIRIHFQCVIAKPVFGNRIQSHGPYPDRHF